MKLFGLKHHTCMSSSFLCQESRKSLAVWSWCFRGVKSGCVQGCSHLKPCLGQRICLQSGSLTWLLAGGLSRSRGRPPQLLLKRPHHMAAGSPQREWPTAENREERPHVWWPRHTPPFPPGAIHSMQVTKSSPHSRRGELVSTFCGD